MSIKLYDKLWVVTHASRGPLSYMCQAGDTAAIRKMQRTGRDWAHVTQERTDDGWVYVDRAGQEATYDNVPVEGFRIGESITRYSTSNKVFRVTDPRGFALEIPTGNLEMLMRDTVIDHGVIQGPCVWGRESGNVLVSVNSEPYTSLIVVSDLAKRPRVKVSELEVGDEVEFHTGRKGIYVGRFVVTAGLTRWGVMETIEVSKRPYFIMGSYYYGYASPHIIRVISKGNNVSPVDTSKSWRDGDGSHLGYKVKHSQPYRRSRISGRDRWGFDYESDYGTASIIKVERV